MATRQQGCLGGLERSLVVLVVTLGELNLAIGPRRVGLACVELGRSLALLGMAARQQRGLGALGFNRLGYVDKWVIVLVVIQNRVDIATHDRGHRDVSPLLAQNA